MKLQYWILLIAVFLIGGYAFRLLFKEIREGLETTADDYLYYLREFVNRSVVSEEHAKYIKNTIAEYRLNEGMNQTFLNSIEITFQERFGELAELDEYDPLNLEVDKHLLKENMKTKIEISSDYYKTTPLNKFTFEGLKKSIRWKRLN